MKKALIFGGTGAMGAFLVDILHSKENWDIYVTSRRQHTSYDNIHYLIGNARDSSFTDRVLSEKWDVIVDFMNYGYDEFMESAEKLVSSTDHYIFLSSSRVYAKSENPLVESSLRLLDTTHDSEFLATQRYALRKARQENKLISLKARNYTIIRPYITFSDNRLQLGVYEKEQWLRRIMNNKPIVIRREILSHITTLTYGYDVAMGIFNIMEKNKPDGSAVHIVSEETKKWYDILCIYIDVLRKAGIDPKIYVSDEISAIEELYEGGYNTKYDRLYDRFFCNKTAEKLCGHIDYLDIESGLRRCLNNFIKQWRQVGDDAFLYYDSDFEQLCDQYIDEGNAELFTIQEV